MSKHLFCFCLFIQTGKQQQKMKQMKTTVQVNVCVYLANLRGEERLLLAISRSFVQLNCTACKQQHRILCKLIKITPVNML